MKDYAVEPFLAIHLVELLSLLVQMKIEYYFEDDVLNSKEWSSSSSVASMKDGLHVFL